jgi:hypothetical protein
VERGMKIFGHKRIKSAVKRVEFVSDRMTSIILTVFLFKMVYNKDTLYHHCFSTMAAIRKVQENWLAYADDVTLLEDNIDTIKKNTETLTDASKEVCLEINIEKG